MTRAMSDNKCPECGGTNLLWSLQLRNATSAKAAHNRMGLHDITTEAVLGCDDCSHTVRVEDGQKHLDATHAQLAEAKRLLGATHTAYSRALEHAERFERERDAAVAEGERLRAAAQRFLDLHDLSLRQYDEKYGTAGAVVDDDELQVTKALRAALTPAQPQPAAGETERERLLNAECVAWRLWSSLDGRKDMSDIRAARAASDAANAVKGKS